VNPVSAVVGIQGRDGMHIIDDIVIPSSNTDELAVEIQRRYPNKKIICYPDPAGSAKKTSAGGRTDHSILLEYGFQVKVRRKHPAVKDRINSMNRMFQNAAGLRNLFVDPSCKTTVDCLTKQQYKEGTMLPDKTSGYDHIPDAFGYMIEYLYPVRPPVTELQTGPFGMTPKRFGHF
jgi:hypothetical protein